MTTAIPRRTRRPRGSIDADMIVRGAFELARRDGLDALSMPGLAAHIGTGVTSLYWYFKTKRDLLRSMYEVAVSEQLENSVRPSDFDPAEWRVFLRSHFLRVRLWYRSDDVATDLIFSRFPDFGEQTMKSLYASTEAALRLLLEAGFTLEQSWFLFWDLSMLTRGFVTTERMRRLGTDGGLPAGRPQLAFLDGQAMPGLAELVRQQPAVLDGTGDASFEHGMDLILESAQRRLEERGVTTSDATSDDLAVVPIATSTTRGRRRGAG